MRAFVVFVTRIYLQNLCNFPTPTTKAGKERSGLVFAFVISFVFVLVFVFVFVFATLWRDGASKAGDEEELLPLQLPGQPPTTDEAEKFILKCSLRNNKSAKVS